MRIASVAPAPARSRQWTSGEAVRSPEAIVFAALALASLFLAFRIAEVAGFVFASTTP